MDETLGTARPRKKKKEETHANEEGDGRANAEKRDTKGEIKGKQSGRAENCVQTQREATKVKTRRGSKNDETCCVLNERTRNFARQRRRIRGCVILETRTEISPALCRNRKRLRNVD